MKTKINKIKFMEISYVIPTLNSASTLDMTILSLKHQEGVKVNILVVDSGSTDGTLDICKRWGVESLYTEPGNMYKAINTGISRFNTEWVAYLNSDDWLYPNSLSAMIEFGDKESADLVYGNCDFVDYFGRLIYSFASAQPNDLPALFRSGFMPFNQQTVIFRRSLYDKLSGFDERYCLSADKHFFARASKVGASFSKLEGLPVACFRIHRGQLSNAKSNAHASESKRVDSELFGSVTLKDKIVAAKWKTSNVGHYCLRFLRQSLLLGKLHISRSTKPW